MPQMSRPARRLFHAPFCPTGTRTASASAALSTLVVIGLGKRQVVACEADDVFYGM